MRALEPDWRGWSRPDHRSAVTIGVLDGVHRGHRALLDSLGSDLVRIVLTFDPHPVEVLAPGTHPRLITTIDERIALLSEAGVQQVGVLDLNAIKHLEPKEFVHDVLVDRLNIGRLVIGPDFRFGKDRAGDIRLLIEMGASFDFEVDVIELIEDVEGVVSSSRIRATLEAGQVEEAAIALTTMFRLANTVVAGDKRGRTIGFPTANLRPPDRKVIPGIGVYAGFARVDGVTHQAAVSVGMRPTFGGGEVLVEVFLLDFEGDLYDKDLKVEFVSYLRPELKFDDVDELVEQMGSDVDKTREVLKEVSSGMG